MNDILDKLKHFASLKYPLKAMNSDVLSEAIAEIERLRAELAKPRRDRAFRAGLLDAAKIAKDARGWDHLTIADRLRQAAERVKDAE